MKTATLGQVRKLLGLLDGVPQEQVQRVLASGLLSDLLLADVAEINRGEFLRVCGLLPKFKVWRTIKLGTGLKTAGDFRRALADGEFGVSDWASDLLGQPVFEVATEETEIDLVVASVAELGFEQGARRDRIYARAKELGLEPCPAEVGPQLRLQYKNQPMGEWLLIAMEPITGSGGDLKIFCVKHDEAGLWLPSGCGSPDALWSPGGRWVFRLPRK
jgi:hypothetical protein